MVSLGFNIVQTSCQWQASAGQLRETPSVAESPLPSFFSQSQCTLGFKVGNPPFHQKAEIKKYSRNDIEKHYEELEKLMLDDFYEFVKRHEKHNWFHWNMRDINYGFQALAHRYKVLGGDPREIDDSNRIDLSRLLTDIYGDKYIGHPRLQKLMEKNQISNRDFLTGSEEADAFKNKEYVKLHQSTLRKVNVIARIAEKAENDSLKTNASLKDIYGSYPEVMGELLKEHWLASFISFISAIVGILGIISLFK